MNSCDHRGCDEAVAQDYYRNFTIDLKGLCAKHQRRAKRAIIWGWFKMRVWREWRCLHKEGIPALRGGQGWKVCSDCGKQIQLTDAQFYAEFGTTINHLFASRNR